MTEDVIIDLSRFPGLVVIARNSVFTYKAKAVDVRQVARELGVAYVLQGSVRKAKSRVRITAQLIKAESGESLWAERYDRDLTDIFALQDEVSRHIVSALAVSLSEADAHRGPRQETTNLQAYDHVLRARQHLAKFKWKETQEAKILLEKAIELDPAYARAYALLGELRFGYWRLWGKNRAENMAKALEFGQKAIELDPDNATAHMLLATVRQWSGRYEQAEAEADKVLALAPSDAETLANLGSYLRLSGRAEESIAALEQSLRLDPLWNPHNFAVLGHAYCMADRCEKAIQTLRRGAKLKPNLIAFQIFQALAQARKGDMAAAQAAAIKALEINPNFTLTAYANFMPYKNRVDEEQDVGDMRKAGLPE